MNFLVTGALLFVALALSPPATAQEVKVGNGVVCDKASQVVRFLTIVNGDRDAAIKQVNAEEKDDDACVYGTIVFILGEGGEKVTNKDGTWQVMEILVLGVGGPAGLRQIQPIIWYTVLQLLEQKA